MLVKPTTRHIVVGSLHLGWLALFYGVPLGLLAVISFWIIENYTLTPAFTAESYKQLLARPQYWNAVENSLRLSLTAAFLAVVSALPAAYAVVFQVREKARRYILLALLLPFFSSYVMRMFAWQIWLNDRGIITALLRELFGYGGVLKLIFTETAVLIGLLSVLVPVAAIMIYLSLSRLDLTLIAASRNLGATRWQTFLLVELPFALPGVIVSSIFCFLIAFGDFVCASILGGNKTYYLSVAIEDRLKINEWPMASALGTIMLILSLGVLGVLFSVFGKLPTTARRKPGIGNA
jgi:ABC-type spermidine/putrescine transport system permease subunit I